MLNKSLLEAKLNAFNKKFVDRSDSMWRPTEGKHTIRIVPLKGAEDWPFVEMQFHYLGNRTYLSPITYGRPDPIHEFAESLLGDDRSKESYQQAKPFLPKMRTFAPVIVRGEEEKGVRFFSFGKTVYKQIMDFMADEDIGDITHPTEGRDLILTYVPQEKSDTNFAKTTVMYKPKVTPLSEDSALAKKFLTEQPDIASLYDELSYAELKKVLEKYLNPETEDSVTEEPEESATAEDTSEKSQKVDSALDEFDALFKS